MKKIFYCVLTGLVVTGCSGTSQVSDSAPASVPIDIHAIRDAVPRHEKRTRAGNPASYEVLGKRYTTLAESKGFTQRGLASWYGTKFHGRKTANGETYNMYAMTAAHKTLPIPSYVRVTHLKNHRSVVVRINDRGPFHEGRIIDLSYAAAVKLGIQKTGTGPVEIKAIEPGENPEITAKPEVNTGKDKLYLQVGAFSDPFNARQLQQKLTQVADAKARLKISQGFYKVQLGPLESLVAADKISQRLMNAGFKSIHLVVGD